MPSQFAGNKSPSGAGGPKENRGGQTRNRMPGIVKQSCDNGSGTEKDRRGRRGKNPFIDPCGQTIHFDRYNSMKQPALKPVQKINVKSEKGGFSENEERISHMGG